MASPYLNDREPVASRATERTCHLAVGSVPLGCWNWHPFQQQGIVRDLGRCPSISMDGESRRLEGCVAQQSTSDFELSFARSSCPSDRHHEHCIKARQRPNEVLTNCLPNESLRFLAMGMGLELPRIVTS